MPENSTIRMLIASPLHSYTGCDEVELEGDSLGELLDGLEARFPGIRFRMVDEQEKIRKHIRFFINGQAVSDLGAPVRAGDEVCMVQALSGG
jgi:molybdopterin converting factor small subunit